MRTVMFLFLLMLTLVHPVGAQTDIDSQALTELKAAAQRAHSDAVIILLDGDLVAEWYFGEDRRPIEVMSVLKSIVGVGIGRLITIGKLESLDTPVHTFYPEWRQGRKQDITVRHLLNHTSGLQDIPNAGAEIYPSPNAVQLALAAELTEDPGTVFRYNNKATNLLAGIIERAYGQRMDQFFVKELFRAMEIDQYKWYYDQSGNPHAMAGLELHARDLAKFGSLVLDNGTWNGEQLVAADYMRELTAQSQPHYPAYGLLWWRLPEETRYVLDTARMDELRAAGVSQENLRILQPLAGKVFTARRERDAALEGLLGTEWRTIVRQRYLGNEVDPVFRREYGEFVACYADGYLGQTLMVVPEYRLVAVRQVRGGPDYNRETDGFPAFKELVMRLVAVTAQ